MKSPDVQYARSGDVAIAYQVLGDGPVDVVYARGMSGDLLSSWDQPLLARLLRATPCALRPSAPGCEAVNCFRPRFGCRVLNVSAFATFTTHAMKPLKRP